MRHRHRGAGTSRRDVGLRSACSRPLGVGFPAVSHDPWHLARRDGRLDPPSWANGEALTGGALTAPRCRAPHPGAPGPSILAPIPGVSSALTRFPPERKSTRRGAGMLVPDRLPHQCRGVVDISKCRPEEGGAPVSSAHLGALSRRCSI